MNFAEICGNEWRNIMSEIKKRTNKYNNKKHEVDGIKFDSRAEARYYMKLKRAGMSFMPLSETYCAMQENVLLQEGFLCEGRRIAPIHYRADFVIYENGQVKKVVDVKGYQDANSMLKMKMFAHRYGFPVTFAKFDSKINKFIEMDCFESARQQRKRQAEKRKKKQEDK
jgi:hypothetical protein